MEIIKNQNWKRNLFWLLPVILAFLQYFYSMQSKWDIQYEELAESVRNPFWLEHHRIYDGISSNIGWYGLVLVAYKIFGFDIHMAVYVRVVLSFFCFLSLCALSKKYLSLERAWIPVVLLGLSPTFLHLNALQASYGIDLQYFPMVLFFLLFNPLNSSFKSGFFSFFMGAIAMIACMSFPTFIYTMPFFLFFFIQKIVKSLKESGRYRNVSSIIFNFDFILGSIGFLLPLVLGALYMESPKALFFEPTTRSGIFRGGGKGHWLTLEPIFKGIWVTMLDLFDRGRTYYFEINKVEFSESILIAIFFIILVLSVLLWRRYRELKWVIPFGWVLMIGNTVMSCVATGPAGLRRCTGVLITIYFFAFLILRYFHELKGFASQRVRDCIAMMFGILLFHHFWVLPINFSDEAKINRSKPSSWFPSGRTPRENLKMWIKNYEQHGNINCFDTLDFSKGPVPPSHCRYAEIYAAIAGHYLWNEERNVDVIAFNPYTAKYEKLIPVKGDFESLINKAPPK